MLFSVAVLYLIAGGSWGFALAYNPRPQVTNINVVNKIFKPRTKRLPLIPVTSKEMQTEAIRQTEALGKMARSTPCPPPTMDMLERARFLKKSSGKGFV